MRRHRLSAWLAVSRMTTPFRGHLRVANVETVARAAALSVRTFHRRCRSELGLTPAKLIDKLRVEHARTLIATSDVLAKNLAEQCGFGTATNMKRAFERELGVGPREYRLLHSRTAQKSTLRDCASLRALLAGSTRRARHRRVPLCNEHWQKMRSL